MPFMSLVFIAVLASFSFALAALGEPWREPVSHKDFWIKNTTEYTVTHTGKDNPITMSAVRFDREYYDYEVYEMGSLFSAHYGEKNLDKGFLFNSDEGTYSRLFPSIREAWKILEEQGDIVALVPIGFGQLFGDAEIVGFRKISGRVSRGVFSARNLDAIFCLDDRQARLRKNFNGQVPTILPLNIKKPAFYRYLKGKGMDTVNFEVKHTFDNPKVEKINKKTLELCPNALQVGPRILEPLGIAPAVSAKGREAFNEDSIGDDKRTPRTVMLYDWNGYLNFVHVQAPATRYSTGQALSAPEFFDRTPEDFSGPLPPKNEDRSNPNGFPCRYGPGKGSRSCEIWAVVVSDNEGAAMLVRADNQIQIWGDMDAYTPGVLVIRKRVRG